MGEVEGKVGIAQENSTKKWRIIVQFSDGTLLVSEEVFDTQDQASKSAEIEWSDKLPEDYTTLRLSVSLKDEKDAVITTRTGAKYALERQ
jgi:hypothetical protein